MSDPFDDDLNLPEPLRQGSGAVTQAPAAAPAAPVVPAKRSLPQAHDRVLAITPRNLDEAWRMADAFVAAGMVPSSLEVKGDARATQATVMAVIMKGSEVGFGPATALQNIMVINKKPCIYGDGVTALLQRSGVVEWIKTEATGDPAVILPDKADYKVTVTIKRKDQTEPYVRSFSYQEAIKGNLIMKKGPWTEYRARQCYWRAFSWAARDACADALHGLGIVEEVRDIPVDAEVVKPAAFIDDASASEGTV